MRMTLLEPRVTATATLEPPKKAEWTDTYAYGYEEIEAPWSFRYAQIGIGISTFFVASRLLIAVIVLPMAIAMRDTPREKSLIVLGAASLVLYCLAAVAGGMAAGMWARNWMTQGLGVGVGVFIIPLLMMLVFSPENWIFFLVRLLFTSGLTLVGSYIGHLVVKPTRIAKS
jgi:hypothetical protein